MTYDRDPARWTSSPEEAPELLRGAFAAARNEGPSQSHIRALAVKLAAASAGGAVAVGAVKAASAGNAVASAATWSAAKIAGVIAIAGSVVTGAVVWQQSGTSQESLGPRTSSAARSSAEPTLDVAAPEQHAAAPVAAEASAASAGLPPRPVVDQLRAPPASASPSIVGAYPAPSNSTNRSRTGAAAAGTAHGARAAAPHANASRSKVPASAKSAMPMPMPTATATATGDETSELQLLKSAQAALAARPRQAFQLTQEHRKLYPKGEFAQERDALAIQALMRAGETESARNLAETFIRMYPGSPNAHRFREAMGIR